MASLVRECCADLGPALSGLAVVLVLFDGEDVVDNHAPNSFRSFKRLAAYESLILICLKGRAVPCIVLTDESRDSRLLGPHGV